MVQRARRRGRRKITHQALPRRAVPLRRVRAADRGRAVHVASRRRSSARTCSFTTRRCSSSRPRTAPVPDAPGQAVLPAQAPHDDRGDHPLDDAPLEKGCLRVVPGTHKLGPLECGGQRSPPARGTLPDRARSRCPRRPAMRSFFLPPGARLGRQPSDEARTTLLVQMRDPTDPPLFENHVARARA